MESMKYFTSDSVVVPLLQTVYILFGVFALCCDIYARKHAAKSDSGAKCAIDRGPISMGRLHATYVALAFAILLLTLNVDVYAGRRAFFAVLNLSTLAYLAFFNIWFRDKLLRLTNHASKIEK